MRVGSLFSGIGGFDLAAHRAGHEVVWQSENDSSASETLAKNFPEIPNLGDIHEIDADRIDTELDLLVGGFPCQDYSVAGKGKGLAGDRGALWWEFHRLIGDIRPTWVLGENVPGLLYGGRRADFETIVRSLANLGYGVVWTILDAQYFGVPQRRRRVFIVGHLGGIPRPEVLALAEGMFGHPEPSRQEGEKPVSSITSRLGTSGPDAADAQAGWLIAFATNQRDEVRELEIAGALAAEPGLTQGTFITTPSVRRLTPLECERLQGFPDGWTEGVADTQRYRQLGNAVTVPVAEWIMRRF